MTIKFETMSHATNANTRVLCNWQPLVLDHTLGEQFRRHMAELGFKVWDIEVRDPAANVSLAAHYEGWHLDGPIRWMLLWSNIRPVRVRLLTGEELSVVAGDVVLIDNTAAEHHAPQDQTERWVIRTGVAVRS